jgi:tetratricopeptide (TPR) repeat protein
MGGKAWHYDRSMMRFRQAALAAALLAASVAGAPVLAQTMRPTAAAAPGNSGLDAELFYQLLLGELNVRSDQPAAGFALILDAARKTNDPSLYQRAVELAFQARDGESALQAARAWKEAFPQSREANRYVLQILVALNRIAESAEPLKAEIALADPKDRSAVIASVARTYARAADKKLAAEIVEQALANQLKDPTTGPAAWTTIGRLRLGAGDAPGALDAARRGQALSPQSEGPVLLALELMDSRQPQAEDLVRNYMQGQPLPEMRMAYARALLDAQRHAEALQQLQAITRERPDLAEAWLAQGALLVQDNQLPQAEASIRKYLDLAQSQPAGEERNRAQAQAFLSLAQIAEKRGDFAQAGAWLDRIESPQALVQAQTRRASILARQGKLEEGRKLIRALPERNPGDARMKLLAEVQLLRDTKHYQAAHDVLARAIAKEPADVDLLYDQAMLAEKMGRFDEMERLLRQLIAKKPDFQHAYNALGFSLAERNVRLPEAKTLIQKALELAPGDPFISDSLAWVEFRMGNKAEALRILQAAYKDRPDPEIAAHLGEVLWSLGEREQAQAIWREGMLLSSDNETLLETLKRLRVKL